MNTEKIDFVRKDLKTSVGESADSLNQLKNTCILISGGTGFMGTWLAELIAFLNDEYQFNIHLILLARDSQEFEAKAAEFKINAENWFDISMTRASFWYKDQAKTFAFIIGLVLSITFNIDSIYITQELWREPTLRQTLVAQAQNANLDTGAKSVSELEEYYADLEIPVGWQSTSLPATPAAWGTKILGFLISALAAMQGAPFWFDILKNILKIKGTPKEEKAKDISPPSTPAPRMEAVG